MSAFANTSLREDLFHSLETSEDYRHAFVEEKIRTGLAAQIKTIRERLPMTQAQFAKLLGKSQSWVARLEDPNEAIPVVPTLLLVSRKLDIGLKVAYVPFSELLNDVLELSPDALHVPRFRDDRKLFPRKPINAEFTWKPSAMPSASMAVAVGSSAHTQSTASFVGKDEPQYTLPNVFEFESARNRIELR